MGAPPPPRLRARGPRATAAPAPRARPPLGTSFPGLPRGGGPGAGLLSAESLICAMGPSQSHWMGR